MPSRLISTGAEPEACSGRSSRRSTRTGKLSCGPTSRLVTVTEPLPPGVASCAITSRVIPRMRRALELRNDRAACRSSSMAPPRAISLESPKSAETTVTGESFGRSILGNTPADNRGRHTWATAHAAKLLLRIVHLIGGHLAGVVIHIAHAGRSAHVDGNRYPIGAR